VVENHNRWRQTLTKTSVTMRMHSAHRNSLKAERRTPPLSDSHLS